MANNTFSGTVVIPQGVTTIGNWAFNGCTLLTSVTYKGTKDQWASISKDNCGIDDRIVTCSNGKVADG